MTAIKFETTVDRAVAEALPKLRPLIGQRVQVTASTAVAPLSSRKSWTLDDFLAHRLERPADIEPVTLEDMERAIAQGAMGEDV